MAHLRREPDRPRKPWRVDWTERGRRRTRRFPTRREAEVFIGDLARGERTDHTRLTLLDWMRSWITTHGVEWEPRTRRDRAVYADRWIVPYLGRTRLADLGRRDIREWRAEIIRAGATPHTANVAVRVLSAALGAAVEDEVIRANPCVGLRQLPVKRRDRDPATLREVEGIRAAMTRPVDRLVVSLMAYAGLRPGEVRALEWRDVTGDAVTVRRGQRVSGGTKTGSVRVVPVIPALLGDLVAVDREGALVCPIGDWDNWAARVYRPARDTVGATCPPYALRHTFASLLIAEGRGVHEVARLLGHANPALTLSTYGHLFDQAQLDAGEGMADAVTRARGHAAPIRSTSSASDPG